MISVFKISADIKTGTLKLFVKQLKKNVEQVLQGKKKEIFSGLADYC